MAKPAIDIQALSTDERLELIGELWDSLDGAALPLTPEQSQELARRMTSRSKTGLSVPPGTKSKHAFVPVPSEASDRLTRG